MGTQTKSLINSYSRLRIVVAMACGFNLCELANPSSFGAVQYWDVTSGNGTNVDPGNGIWDLVQPYAQWNNNGTNGLWINNNQAVFAGPGALASNLTGGTGIDMPENTYSITLNDGVSSSNNSALHFNNTGFQILGNSLNIQSDRAFTITGTGNTVVNVAPGKSATIGAHAVILFAASILTGQRTTLGIGSTLNIASGAIYRKIQSSNDGLARGTIGFTGGGTLNISGTLSYEAAPNSGGVVLAANSGDNITVNLNTGGLISSNSNVQGVVLSGNANTITLNVAGSISTIGTATYGGISMLANNAAGNATLNLNSGGTISTFAVTPTFNGTNHVGTSTFNFNGGTISPITNHASFLTGLSAVNIKTGGAYIDTNGFNITIGNNLLDGGGQGGLTKLGAGTLTLSGNLAYAGSTTISNGKLITTKAIQNNAAIQIAATSILEVPANGGTSSVTASGMINFAGTASRLELHNNDLIINYENNPSPYAAIVEKVKTGLVLLGGSGSEGITSVEVDNQTIPGTVLAVVDNGDPNLAGGITSLSDLPIPSPATSILVKYTWFGDANLDGIVDGSDYALTDTGFTSNNVLSGWVFGDFNFDSYVTGEDYALLDTGFIAQNSALPEPSISYMMIFSLGLILRNRSNRYSGD